MKTIIKVLLINAILAAIFFFLQGGFQLQAGGKIFGKVFNVQFWTRLQDYKPVPPGIIQHRS